MTAKQAVLPNEMRGSVPLRAETVLNTLEAAIVVLDEGGRIQFLNGAGEQFFEASQSQLVGQALSAFLPADSPLFGLIAHARKSGASVSEFGLELASPRIARHLVNVQAAGLADHPGWVVVSLLGRSIADKIDRQITHRNAARSATAMAAMLAHEVKNPLSGIRGAAQLLEQTATPDNRTLTRLICDETDRICALVDRMEMFSDDRPIERGPVNIHEVLNHVRDLAASGFAAGVRFIEHFDPSLPPVLGNRDLLIQALLNLVKNAAEAAPTGSAEIILGTAYRQGVWVAVPGSRKRLNLPLEVSIQDNGEGIAEELQPHLFEAFVSSRATGTGLGLALVAKIVRDHGGLIEFQSQPRRTVFRLNLPVFVASEEAEHDHE